MVNAAAPGLTPSTLLCPGDVALHTQKLSDASPHQTVLTDTGMDEFQHSSCAMQSVFLVILLQPSVS